MKYSGKTRLSVRKRLYDSLITLLYEKNSIHIGSCLSCLDILIETLIFTMNRRDRFIFSKGHAAPSLYVVLNYLKKISSKELQNFLGEGTILPAHPSHSMEQIIPYASGSLGHGLSFACGLAAAFQSNHKKNPPNVYCLISDGECNEGQVWEAAQYANRFSLHNLIVIVDKNRIQAMGTIEEVLGDPATAEKWRAFGWDVYECSGHDLKALYDTYKKIFRSKSSKPKVIIGNTIKGYGVSFMENTLKWHYNKLDENLFTASLKSLHTKLKKQ